MERTTSYKISVIVVSDFEASKKKNWKDELRMAKALANQDFDEDFEIIVVESTLHKNEPVPAQLKELLPQAKLIFHDSIRSAELKDHGVGLATGKWVAVLEADCVPEPGWLRLVMEAANKNPSMDVISGRTHYGNSSSYKRVMTLLDRSHNDSGRSKSASFISNNGALYRKSLLEAFPYPDAITPFLSARLRNKAMREQGHRFYFERSALMQHAIGGLSFIKDQHTNFAYMEMKMEHRQTKARIPIVLARMLWSDLKRYRWLNRIYLRWYDWPLALLLVIAVRIPETRGLLYAVQDVSEIPESAYR